VKHGGAWDAGNPFGSAPKMIAGGFLVGSCRQKATGNYGIRHGSSLLYRPYPSTRHMSERTTPERT
jgi:hypothetical protein